MKNQMRSFEELRKRSSDLYDMVLDLVRIENSLSGKDVVSDADVKGYHDLRETVTKILSDKLFIESLMGMVAIAEQEKLEAERDCRKELRKYIVERLRRRFGDDIRSGVEKMVKYRRQLNSRVEDVPSCLLTLYQEIGMSCDLPCRS